LIEAAKEQQTQGDKSKELEIDIVKMELARARYLKDLEIEAKYEAGEDVESEKSDEEEEEERKALE
jgi:hypothetical protein